MVKHAPALVFEASNLYFIESKKVRSCFLESNNGFISSIIKFLFKLFLEKIFLVDIFFFLKKNI